MFNKTKRNKNKITRAVCRYGKTVTIDVSNSGDLNGRCEGCPIINEQKSKTRRSLFRRLASRCTEDFPNEKREINSE